MEISIRYHSRGGNTKRLAETIATELGLTAKPVSEPLTGTVDILFLCTAPYAFDVDDEVKNFIRSIDVPVGKAVLFSTSAAVKSIRKYVEKLFEEKKIPLAEDEFSCRGQFLMLHKGRPNDEDLKEAVQFAKKIAASGV